MTDATLLNAGARPILRFERHLARPVDEVWRAVTDPEEMRSWFPTRIDIDEWRVGAELTHHFDGQRFGPLRGRVLEWNPPRSVRFTWGDDTIAFDLSEHPNGGTTFVLTEELSSKHAARNAAGWETCLDHLEFGEERESWEARFDRYSEEFVPVLGPQEGPPES